MAKRSTEQTKPKKSETDTKAVDYKESDATKTWRLSLRAFALKALLPIEVVPDKSELKRMFVKEQRRFLEMLSPNTVSVWMYKNQSLNGLLYALLMRYTDYEQECFTAAMDQFSVFSDAELLNAKFSNEWEVPEERLCVIYLGTASRNAYLTEILNELVRHRLKRVPRSRTIFLFEGTRPEFITIYGNVGECELNRDSYVIDWNKEAEQHTNKRKCINEGVISRTVQTVVAQPKPSNTSASAKPEVPKQVQIQKQKKSKPSVSKGRKDVEYRPDMASSIDDLYNTGDGDNF